MLAATRTSAGSSSAKDNAITVNDQKTLAISGVIKTCKQPRHRQLVADSTQLIVACGDSTQADVTDLATHQSVGQVPLGDDPEIFDPWPDGKWVFATSAVARMVHAVDADATDLRVSNEPGAWA